MKPVSWSTCSRERPSPKLRYWGDTIVSLSERMAGRYVRPLSRDVLEIPTRGPNGEGVEALWVTSLVAEAPLETHVFTSLLTKRPLYVGTKRGIWRVDANKISLLDDRPSDALGGRQAAGI